MNFSPCNTLPQLQVVQELSVEEVYNEMVLSEWVYTENSLKFCSLFKKFTSSSLMFHIWKLNESWNILRICQILLTIMNVGDVGQSNQPTNRLSFMFDWINIQFRIIWQIIIKFGSENQKQIFDVTNSIHWGSTNSSVICNDELKIISSMTCKTCKSD